jgi:hypothetical protein
MVAEREGGREGEGDQAEDMRPGQEAERDILRVDFVSQEVLEAAEVGDDVVMGEVHSLHEEGGGESGKGDSGQEQGGVALGLPVVPEV